MSIHSTRSRLALLIGSAVLLATGVSLIVIGAHTEHPPRPSAADALAPDAAGRPGPPGAAAPPRVSSPPTRIRIPAVGIDAPIIPEGLDASGQLQVPPPTEPAVAAWYRGGPAPGSSGASIIYGHVDTAAGPAVFYRLGGLHKNQRITLDRADRTTVTFTIDAVEVYDRDRFPAARVYTSTPAPELRLITCGGGFSKTAGYLGNVVIYAHLVS